MGNTMGNYNQTFINNIKLLDVFDTNEKVTENWLNIKTDLTIVKMIDFLPFNLMFFFDTVKHILLSMIEKYTPYIQYVEQNNLPKITEKEIIKCTIDFIEYFRTCRCTLNQPRFHEAFPNNVYAKYFKMALEKNDKILLLYTMIPQFPQLNNEDTFDVEKFGPLQNHKLIIFPIEIEEKIILMMFGQTYFKRKETTEIKNDLFERVKGFYVHFTEENVKDLFEDYRELQKKFDLEFEYDLNSLVF